MKLPELQDVKKYVGLYVVDFGDGCSVGFTAVEVAEILESEKYSECKVYKIHNAYPDSRIELKGVPRETFELEAGMFFYSQNLSDGEKNFKELTNLAIKSAAPSRAKVHLAKYDSDRFVAALIYPAEFDDEFSRWLLDNDFRTRGAAAGGVGAVQQYYDSGCEVLQRQQLLGAEAIESRTGVELLANLKQAVQR